MNQYQRKEADLKKKIAGQEGKIEKLEQKISLAKNVFYGRPFVLPGVENLCNDANQRNRLRR